MMSDFLQNGCDDKVMNWLQTTVGEHCKVTSSKRFHLEDRSDSGVPFFCSKEIIQLVNGQEVLDCDYIREEAYEQVKRQFGVPIAGDLLITTRGTYGIPYLYRDTDKFYFADGNLTWLKDFDDLLWAPFLYYWIRSYEGQSKIDAIAKGTAQKAVPIAEIKNIAINLPPIETQRHIACILSAYDSLIETNQRQIKLLEEAAQRLYKEWFVDLRYPGHENVPVVDGVPEGWEKKKLIDESAILRRGISPSYDDNGKYTVISQKCIRNVIMNIREARRQTKEYPVEMNLQDADTVICSTGTGTLGRIGQVFGEQVNTTFDSHVTLVRAKYYPNYFYHAIKAQESYLMGMGRGSTNQQELYKNVIEDLDIVIPTNDVISQAEQLFGNYHLQINVLKNSFSRLSEARDRLLPKLMSGEIAV